MYPSRFNFFQEDGEDKDDDKELDETLDEIETETKEEDSDDDIDIDSFGTDTSDVQNEYDEKEVEMLNNLIAAENDAMNDYFEAGKNTNQEILRRLYADIGAEERFHAEQLIYAKCTITGEKYEPRDPKVKEEYEELLEMGMDEDTAATTAIDRQSMSGSDDGDDSDMEELEQEAAMIETMLFQNELITTFCEQFSKSDMDKAVSVFIEAFIQEEMDNVASMPKEVTKVTSPLKLLSKGLIASINGLIRMGTVIRDTVARNKTKSYRKMQWIKKHGIGDLFKNGIKLYFYSDKDMKIDMETPSRYVDLLYRITKKIGENCGIRLNEAAKHKTITNAIRFDSISAGLNILKNVVLTPTKIVVTDNNKDALAREFFGYSDEKLGVSVTRGDDNLSVRDSNNIYNRLNLLSLVTKEYCKISVEVLNRLEALQGDVSSIYYKNRKMYNDAVNGMKLVVAKYNEFIKAMAHDLKVIISLDSGLLKMTQDRDKAEQNGGKYEGPDIRVSSNTMTQGKQNNYSTTSKPKRVPNKW